jgi:transposase-like protein
MTGKTIIKCLYCHSSNIKKEGKRKSKFQIIQKYSCKSCSKNFSDKKLEHKTYPSKIILNAISYYNLGNSQIEVSKLINQRYKIKVPQRTISEWLKEYKTICTFSRLRKQSIKLYNPSDMIFSQKLQHNQIYKYQLHKVKLKLTSKELPAKKFVVIKDYLNKIPTNNFPHHIFQPKQEELNELARSSQIKFKTLDFIKEEKQNQANKLVNLALNLANNNKQRHEAIQNFMITNDSTTIACEVPVYLTNDDIKYFQKKKFNLNLENYQTPITGHIDILQIRNGLIHILDYKPKANKINAIEQLTIYALALASRTKLALKDFKCAWFDENNYFEFFPLHVVYEKRKVLEIKDFQTV